MGNSFRFNYAINKIISYFCISRFVVFETDILPEA
jgi:hypothetical protein